MKTSPLKKSNTTVAVSPETAIRLDLFCKKSNITKKDFISLSLDFFDNVQLTPNDSGKVLSWKAKSEDISALKEEIRGLNARSEQTNLSIANMHGMVTKSVASDIHMHDMIEAMAIEQSNNTKLLEEIKGRKRHWWQHKK